MSYHKKNSNDKWKRFEHLVTAIHKAADAGADVRWNEKINGRQFDVTTHFKKGLYEYLTVIECKDYKKPVSVEKVDAFVTKSRDVGAHNAILASTAGFQKGAKEAAEKHNITLINITESEEIDVSLFGAKLVDPTDALHIKTICLVYKNGQHIQIPGRADAMAYYVKNIFLKRGAVSIQLDNLLQEYQVQFIGGKQDSFERYVIPVFESTEVVPPNEEIPAGTLKEIIIEAGMVKARTYSGPCQFEPYLITPYIKVQNVGSGLETIFSQRDLALGVDTEFEAGKFYENPHLAMNYYCDAIDRDIASLILVESFQNGMLVQARIEIETTYADRYVELKDTHVISRLKRRLDRFLARG